MDLANVIGVVKGFFTRIKNGTRYRVIVVDLGGGDVRTLDHFPPINDDSYPLPSDFVATDLQVGEGRARGQGVIDPKNLLKSLIGEKRIYARAADTGAQVCEVWLKNDGSVTVINGSGHIRLQADGEVNINGARITTGGNVITASGVSLDGHPHSQNADSDGDSQVNTNPPIPTEA